MAPRILRDTLRDKSVVIFRTPDAADDDVDAVVRLVGQGGATTTATIGLTPQFVDANSSEKLLSVVNSPIVPVGRQLSTASVDQGSQAGDLLGIALLRGKEQAVPDDQRETVLATLRDTGFITYDARGIEAADTAVVVTGGSLGDDAGNRGPRWRASPPAWPRTAGASCSPGGTDRRPGPRPSRSPVRMPDCPAR